MKHAGLLMTSSPRTQDGKLSKENNAVQREKHLDAICGVGVPTGYAEFFARWKDGLARLPAARNAIAEANSRTLIGHGLAATHEVGLSLHHTYGVPYLPGSSLKGVLAHYVDEVLGSTDAAFRGPVLDAETGQVTREPGARFRAIFGAAPSEGDELGFEGYVEFHDALVEPPADQKLLVRDVLTPHQVTYYRDGSADPNDYTSPIPVGFVTARPGLSYHLVLSGPAQWTSLALKLLKCALDERGVGGKTTSGYGRFTVTGGTTPEELAREEQEEQERQARAAAEEQERRTLETAAAQEEEARRVQREELVPGLRKWVADGASNADELSRLLEIALSLVAAGKVPIEKVVEALSSTPKAERVGFLEARRNDWPELAKALDVRWNPREVEEVLNEIPAKLWLAGKGLVHSLQAGQTRVDELKAHVLDFEGGKLYQNKAYRMDVPETMPDEANVVLLIDPKGKVVGVKKP